jgi:hypothetical protein
VDARFAGIVYGDSERMPKMNLMLNIWGPEFPVDQFLEAHPDVLVRHRWRRGEPSSRQRNYEQSGFNVVIGTTDSLDRSASDVVRRLEQLRLSLEAARSLGADVALDIGLLLPVGRPMKTLPLSVDILRELVSQGIRLRVCGYAVFDAGDGAETG